MNLLTLAGNSTKEKILNCLAKTWPLSAKKIYNSLKKDYKLSISYQAAHKALQEMLDENVINKSDEGYQINSKWLSQIGDFSDKMLKEIEQVDYKKELKAVHKITFKHHGEFTRFFIDYMSEVLKKEGKLDVAFHYRHVPHPFVLSSDNLKKLEMLLPKANWTILSKNDSPVSRWNAKQWEKFGVKTKICADIFADSLIILNNHIINIHTRKESLEKWDERVKNLEEYEIRPVVDESKRMNTIATFMEDQELAEILNKFDKV